MPRWGSARVAPNHDGPGLRMLTRDEGCRGPVRVAGVTPAPTCATQVLPMRQRHSRGHGCWGERASSLLTMASRRGRQRSLAVIFRSPMGAAVTPCEDGPDLTTVVWPQALECSRSLELSGSELARVNVRSAHSTPWIQSSANRVGGRARQQVGCAFFCYTPTHPTQLAGSSDDFGQGYTSRHLVLGKPRTTSHRFGEAHRLVSEAICGRP
jgi:hypothetical protein